MEERVMRDRMAASGRPSAITGSTRERSEPQKSSLQPGKPPDGNKPAPSESSNTRIRPNQKLGMAMPNWLKIITP